MNAESTKVSRAELLSRLARDHQLLEATLAALTPRQHSAPGVLGKWSVKDILAHLIAHEQQALDELRDARLGERIEIDHASLDLFNAEAVRASHARSYDEVHASWNASYREVVAAVETLPDEDFAPDSPIAQTLGDSIDGALGNNTYAHYAEHRAEIEHWLHGK